jgi:hypothetical protein
MGVDITTYLMYGVKLKSIDFEKQFEETFPDEEGYYEYLQEEVEGHPNAAFDVVDDNMMGEYIVFGKVIAQMGEREEEFTVLSDKDFPDASSLIDKINNKLKTDFSNSDFKLLFFNHFW